MNVATARAAGAALILIASGAAAPASAQDFFKAITDTIGLTSTDQPEITYRERPPLVVPPNDALPQPERAGVPNDPRWPVDPDEVERQRIAAQRGKPVNTEARTRSDLRDQPALSPAERRVLGRSATPPVAQQQPAPHKSDSAREEWLNPDELRAMRAPDEPKLAQGVEPPRQSLTDPPVGLRMPAANAPIRASREASEDRTEPNVREYQRSLQRN